ANIFNMAIIGGVGGWAAYALLLKLLGTSAGLRSRILAAVVAAWLSTLASAIVCAGELAISGTAPWQVAFPAMAGVHMLIGLGEGVITAMVLAAIGSVRPELLTTPAMDLRRSLWPLVAYGFLA